ncbi:MAG: hypothetical protein WCX32_01725 [Clostridia bacterium]|jgi:hypothetical protein|nr:hypothetical protein [Clostridia bacterium]MDD4275528.1 hypothetical protein [Clostridia bacterium]
MGGVVGYGLFTARLGSGTNGMTTEGGFFETFTNNTGTSVKGTIVVASTTVDNGVDIAPANSQMPIGVIYETGIINGSPVKVVVYGKADVLLKDGETATSGYWCGVSNTAGRMYQAATVPSTTEHNRETGHSLKTTSSGTNVLSLIQVHFN